MKYLFFVSWLRAKEKKLADRIDIDRMIAAPNNEEAFRVLNDTDYAPYLSGKNNSDIEEIIEEEKFDFRRNLEKMGMEKEMIEFLFLKEEFSKISKEIKENILKGNSEEKKFSQGKKENREIIKKIKENSPEKAEDIDRILLDEYFQRANIFLQNNKEKEMKEIFDEYYKIIRNERGDLKKRDDNLFQIEEKILEKSNEEIGGVLPIFSFLIKKKRVEYLVRSVFAGRRVKMDSKEIYELIDLKKRKIAVFL